MTKKPLHPLKAIALCLLIMPWHGCFGAQQNQIEIRYGNDQKVSIAYKPEKTIAEVKKELVSKTNISFNKQKLTFATTTLRNRKTLKDHNIPKNATIHLSEWNSPQELFVKTLMSETITLDYDPQDTIQEIKEEIQDKEGMPPQQQTLLFNKQQLGDDDQTLQQYNVPCGSTLNLRLGLRNYSPPPSSNNINENNNNIINNNNNINIINDDEKKDDKKSGDENINNTINEIKDNINETKDNINKIEDSNNRIQGKINKIKDDNNEIKNNIINPPNNQRNNNNNNNEINDNNNNNNRGNKGLNNQRNNNNEIKDNNNNEINDDNNNDNNNTTTYVVIALVILGIIGIGYVAHNKSTQKPTKEPNTSKQAA